MNIRHPAIIALFFIAALALVIFGVSMYARSQSAELTIVLILLGFSFAGAATFLSNWKDATEFVARFLGRKRADDTSLHGQERLQPGSPGAASFPHLRVKERDTPKPRASWTVVDEYEAVVRRICHNKNYDVREDTFPGQDRAKTRRFIAESRAIHTVQVQGHFSWQQYETKTLPMIRVDITIYSEDLQRPVTALKWGIGTTVHMSQLQYSKNEIDTYTNLQEDFVNALLDGVDQVRRKLADDGGM